MSFSSDIKQELNKNSNLANKQIVQQELIGYLISGNTSIIKGNKIKFSTESDYNINRFSKLLSNLNINHEISISGKSFYITIKKKEIELVDIEQGKIEIKEQIGNNEEETKAFIRGIFMGAGSINNPENKYHLEMILSDENNLELVSEILEKTNINIKTFKSEQKFSLYIKEGEEISKFLAYIGANKAVMQFEDIRIQREMRRKSKQISKL